MPNTIRIDVKNEKNINRKTIIDIMTKELKIKSSLISYVSTPYNSKSWLVSFKEEYDIKKILDINVTINEEMVTIRDYNKPKKLVKYNTYKLLWLPHGTNLIEVEKYVLESVKVLGGDVRVTKIKEEIYVDRDAPEVKEIKTGNIIVTISYLEDIPIKDIRGIKDYYGKRLRIVQFGDEMKCFSCHETGHIKSKCPYVDHTCETCGNKGHRTCNYASRINSNQNENFPQHDGDTDFGDLEKKQNGLQNSTLNNEQNTNENVSLESSQINSIEAIKKVIIMDSEKNKKFNNMKIFLGPSKNTFKRSNDNRSLNSSTSPTKIINKKTKSREDSSEEEEMEESAEEGNDETGNQNNNNENENEIEKVS